MVVNTCAFIEAARQESIDTVLPSPTPGGPGARLVVTGCMAERYGDELAEALPEVDLVARFGASLRRPPPPPADRGPRPRPAPRSRSARSRVPPAPRALDSTCSNLPRPAARAPGPT